MIEKTPLPGAFGVSIHGLDLSKPLSAEVAREVISALHEHQVICIPGQNLAPGSFQAFTDTFGTAIPHVLDHLRMEEHPGVMLLTNKGNSEENRNGAAFWHTDQSYEAQPSSATFLHAKKVLETGGETRIANMAMAYDALSASMKKRIAGLEVMHLYGSRDAGKGWERGAAPFISDDQRAKAPMVKHPLVLPHPVTGRFALYAVAGTPQDIVGMPHDEAISLLDELKAHATSEPFVYLHKWTVGDVAGWDTSATLHASTIIPEGTGDLNLRILQRVSVRGIPPMFQSQVAQQQTALPA